jgi:hypothetical protein
MTMTTEQRDLKNSSHFNSYIQAKQYERLCGEGYEYLEDKGDTIVVGLDRDVPFISIDGLDHDVASSCEWRAHTVEINVNGDMVYHYH